MAPEFDDLGAGSPTVDKPLYRMRLFVAGNEPNSARARDVLARLCAAHLQGRCEIEVVDVFEDYQAAISHHIVAVPTLIVEAPPPRRVIVGSLADEGKVLAILGLPEKGAGHE